MVKLTCFHNLIISGIPSIAFLLASSFAGICLSHLCPFTFWPSPVPLTRRPFSNDLASLNAEDFRLAGNKDSTPCFWASFTRSACRRNEKCGACQRLVSGLRQGRNGLGGWSSSNDNEDGGVSIGGVDVGSIIDPLGSEVDVVEVVDIVGMGGGAFDGRSEDGLGRVSGMDSPVYFAE
jgi:hypothetical protein